MSDLEKFEQLYESFGVKLTKEIRAKHIEVNIDEAINPKINHTWAGFSLVKFDLNGKFISQTFWGE